MGIKVVGGVLNHDGEYQRLFLDEDSNQIMFDNAPMGYCITSFDGDDVPVFDPITLSSPEYIKEEVDMLNLLRMYAPVHRGIIKLQNGEYLLIKDYSPMHLSLLTKDGIKDSTYSCGTDEIDEDDEEGLDLVYLVVTLREAGY